ncbi:MAG: glutamine synthetase [Myxococcota bacterium]|nr:glutamine synthetase [Myxococcota bacterium]
MTTPLIPQTPAEAKQLIEASGHRQVKVGLFDGDAILRGKYMSLGKFNSALEKGFGFCDVVLGWDAHDQLYEKIDFTGWHSGYPDAQVRIIPDSMRRIPFEGGLPFFLAEFVGEAEALCPRGVLRRVLDRASSMGYDVLAGAEYEFFLFDESPDSVREKGYRDLKTITPGYFGYSLLRAGVHAEFYHELLELAEAMRFPIEGLHTESGAGVLEAALQVDDALAAADKAALFKTFTKIIAQRRGWMATFMAKWSPDWPGQSGHIHLSLRHKEGSNAGRSAFYDATQPHAISEAMRHFIGGQQALMGECLAMVANTVNSYSRLIPGFWAPTSASWGVENRTCALRVIPGSEKSQRVEFRIAAADMNPYLALAAAIASGLWGIEHRIEPTPAVEGNGYEHQLPDELQLPRTLWEAAQRLKSSAPARALFGDRFVEHFAATREAEELAYRRAISDWELARYFEII